AAAALVALPSAGLALPDDPVLVVSDGQRSGADLAYAFPATDCPLLAKELWFTNAGGRSTSALSVSLTGLPAFLKAVDGCSGRALAAGRTCSVVVAFVPRLTGLRPSVLTVSARHVAPATVELTSDQAITFDELPDRTFGDAPFDVHAVSTSWL